jgi:MscS family membrane protein
MADGPREGEFLFSSNTVDRTREFYNRVKNLPYKRGASIGVYEDLIFDPGSMIPKEILNQLPSWMTYRLRGQRVWQWMGLLLSVIIVFSIILILNRITRVKEDEESGKYISWTVRKLINPLSVLILFVLLSYFVEEQVSITGRVWLNIKAILRIVVWTAAAWATLIIGKGAAEIFISSKRARSKGIDANITRIVFRLISIVIIMVGLWNVSDRMGVSLAALFASAGIAGMAVAFAARETIANFFGGASILLDRPFKAGDYIILDSGERGEVLEVGLRSTRLLTRDDVQISIPNSTITNTKIINESAPRPHFRVRIKVGVAYGSDIEKVESILLRLASENQLVRKVPEPCVRMRGFGESSVDFELLCLTHKAEDKGKLIHSLYWNIYMEFDNAGIVIPFPQRDVHIHGDESQNIT